VTSGRLLLLAAGLLSLVTGERPAAAGRRASLACRKTIGRNVREFVHTSLAIIEGCQRRGANREVQRLEAVYGGFAGEPLHDDSREYVFVARR